MTHPFDQEEKYCGKHNRPKVIAKRQTDAGATVITLECSECEITKKWHVLIFQSGSTIVTNDDIAMYFHGYASIAGDKPTLTDAELDAKKAQYAQWVCDVLNAVPEPDFVEVTK